MIATDFKCLINLSFFIDNNYKYKIEYCLKYNENYLSNVYICTLLCKNLYTPSLFIYLLF